MNTIKVILSNVKEYKIPTILTPVCMVGEVAMEMVIPLLMASIIDEGVNKGNMQHIIITGIWMVICALIGLFFGLGGGFFGARASTGLAKNLRKAEFDHIQEFSFANIDHFGVSGLVTRMTTDITNIQNAFQMVLRIGFRAPTTLIVAMAMAFFINARLASVYLIAVLVLSVFIFFVMKKANRYFREVFGKYDALNESVQENVSAIRVVKSFVREDFEKEKFGKAVLNLYSLFVRAERVVLGNLPVMTGAIYTCVLLLSWFGARMIVGGSLTTGELMSLLTYCMNILMSIMMLSMIFVMISMSEASMERIGQVLTEVPSLTNPADPDYEIKDGAIRFDHVFFSYNDSAEKPVLDDVCLDIRAGETIGIIGGTGSSKSSLVNLIPRLYDAVSGTVYVGGKDVRSYDIESLRNNVSVVLQKNVLFSGSILENLRWGDPEASDEDCITACRLACADEFIEKLPEKYETFVEQGGANLSGGQRQRLCIARALMKKPKILILDDSTSAVDTATDAKIRKTFNERIPDTTILIISQRVSSVQNADRIIVMDDGKIDGFGTHEELLETNEIYRDVYESQMEGDADFDEGGVS